MALPAEVVVCMHLCTCAAAHASVVVHWKYVGEAGGVRDVATTAGLRDPHAHGHLPEMDAIASEQISDSGSRSDCDVGPVLPNAGKRRSHA